LAILPAIFLLLLIPHQSPDTTADHLKSNDIDVCIIHKKKHHQYYLKNQSPRGIDNTVHGGFPKIGRLSIPVQSMQHCQTRIIERKRRKTTPE
jgi:hypothetical protein